MAPRDGFEIRRKTSAMHGVSDCCWVPIPPKTPLPKGGCSRTLAGSGRGYAFGSSAHLLRLGPPGCPDKETPQRKRLLSRGSLPSGGRFCQHAAEKRITLAFRLSKHPPVKCSHSSETWLRGNYCEARRRPVRAWQAVGTVEQVPHKGVVAWASRVGGVTVRVRCEYR